MHKQLPGTVKAVKAVTFSNILQFPTSTTGKRLDSSWKASLRRTTTRRMVVLLSSWEQRATLRQKRLLTPSEKWFHTPPRSWIGIISLWLFTGTAILCHSEWQFIIRVHLTLIVAQISNVNSCYEKKKSVTVKHKCTSTCFLFRTGFVVPVYLPAKTNVFITNGLSLPWNKVLTSTTIIGIPQRTIGGAISYSGLDFFFELNDALSKCNRKEGSQKNILYPAQAKDYLGEMSLMRCLPSVNIVQQEQNEPNLLKEVDKLKQEKNELRDELEDMKIRLKAMEMAKERYRNEIRKQRKNWRFCTFIWQTFISSFFFVSFFIVLRFLARHINHKLMRSW